jgi:hypothetical protein
MDWAAKTEPGASGKLLCTRNAKRMEKQRALIFSRVKGERVYLPYFPAVG